MTLDLNKLENKLDEALSNETSETLNKFLNDKRMTNNKQQTAVEWLWEIAYNRELTVKDWKQAKAMHKEEMVDFAMKFMMQDRPVVTFYNETFNNNEQH